MKKLFYILCCSLAVLFVACEKGEPSDKSDSNKSSGKSDANVHEYVDLGLSVKWATCNVGADSPEDYGDYFAWGETEPNIIGVLTNGARVIMILKPNTALIQNTAL